MAIFFLAVTVVAALTEEPKEVPAEVKTLLDRFYAATNGGEWDTAASICGFPWRRQGDGQIFQSKDELSTYFQSWGGLICKKQSVEWVDTEAIKPLLTEIERGFLTKHDFLVRQRVQWQWGQRQYELTALCIVRHKDSKFTLHGAINDRETK